MSSHEAIRRSNEPSRPLKRVEYDALVEQGFFDDEKVELLFGLVVPMSPIDPAHSESGRRVRDALMRQLAGRATICNQDPLAASDISEPEPDVMVVPLADYWKEHPTKAFLVVEVARSSLAKDQGLKCTLYGLAEVNEYWIVNHVDTVIEVYRDPGAGTWREVTRYGRGETITMLAFPDVRVAVSDILPPV